MSESTAPVEQIASIPEESLRMQRTSTPTDPVDPFAKDLAAMLTSKPKRFSRFEVQVLRDLEPDTVSQALLDKKLKSYFCRMLRAQAGNDIKEIYMKVGGKNPVTEAALEENLRSCMDFIVKVEGIAYPRKVEGIAYPGHFDSDCPFLEDTKARWSKTNKYFPNPMRHPMPDVDEVTELLRDPDPPKRRWTRQTRFSSRH